MTKIINFADYQKQAARTMKPGRLLKEDLADYTMGLSGEVGELLNKIKRTCFIIISFLMTRLLKK